MQNSVFEDLSMTSPRVQFESIDHKLDALILASFGVE